MNDDLQTATSPWKRRFFVLSFSPSGSRVYRPAARQALRRRRSGRLRQPAEHFKYGSTGGEHEMGFPYWIWRALPRSVRSTCRAKGYQSLGMV